MIATTACRERPNLLAHTLTGDFALMTIHDVVVFEHPCTPTQPTCWACRSAFCPATIGSASSAPSSTRRSGRSRRTGASASQSSPCTPNWRERIRAGVEAAFSGDIARHRVELPEHFDFRL